LPYLAGWTDRRRTIARRYREDLATMPLTVPPEFDAGHVYHLFPLLSPHRAALQDHLASRGVETLIHYPVPIPRQPALEETNPAVCPIADRICAEVLSLPIYPALPDEAVNAVLEGAAAFHP
jgi:dTDP-4-amino-4,6-dideoxygalactose transaminase